MAVANCSHVRRAAVSEVIATLLLIVVAASAGVILVSWASSYSSGALGGLASSAYRAQAALRQHPVIEFAVASASSGNVTLMVSDEDQLPVTVVGVIISNSTSYEYYPQFYVYSGTSWVQSSSVQIRPYGVVEVRVVARGYLEANSPYIVSVLTSSGARASAVVGVGP
jgi:hypothetical protein